MKDFELAKESLLIDNKNQHQVIFETELSSLSKRDV